MGFSLGSWMLGHPAYSTLKLVTLRMRTVISVAHLRL